MPRSQQQQCRCGRSSSPATLSADIGPPALWADEVPVTWQLPCYWFMLLLRPAGLPLPLQVRSPVWLSQRWLLGSQLAAPGASASIENAASLVSWYLPLSLLFLLCVLDAE